MLGDVSPAVPSSLPLDQRDPAVGATDPRELGCRCDECYLGRQFAALGHDAPVLPEVHKHDAEVAIIAEAPGAQEERRKRPLIGPSGRELMRGLSKFGIERQDVVLDNGLMCLHGDSKVLLGDGTARPIRQLVAERYDGEVMSVDSEGQLVRRRIIGWYRNKRAGRRLFKVSSRRAKGVRVGVVGPIVTEDHEIRAVDGKDGGVRWIPAAEIAMRPDRYSVFTRDPRPKSGSAAADVVAGSLLGDGTISKGKRCMQIGHGADQEEWLRLKQRALGDLAQDRITRVSADKLSGTQDALYLRTVPSRYFAGLRHDHYNEDSTRRIPEHFSLTARALAVWYLDDGHLRLRQGRRPRISINQTKLQGPDLARLLRALKQRLGLRATTSSKGRISFDAANTQRLLGLIAGMVPPCLEYKTLPKLRGLFNPDYWQPSTAVSVADDPIIEEVERRGTSVFCVDVEETHNFVTTDVVVHNCRPPDNKLKRVMHAHGKIKKAAEAKAKEQRQENKKRRKLGMPQLPIEPVPPSPIECCRPHILQRAQHTPNIIALGATSFYSITGEQKAIRKLRGAFVDRWLVEDKHGNLDVWKPPSSLPQDGIAAATPEGAQHLRIVPTLHPAYVLRSPAWREAFQQDIGRFVRWMKGELEWKEPWLVVKPNYQQLKDWLYSADVSWHATDAETDPVGRPMIGKDGRQHGPAPIVPQMRCLCFSSPEGSMVVPFRSIRFVENEAGVSTGHYRWLGRRGDEQFTFYPQAEAQAIWELIRHWLMDPSRLKVGHNSRYFDAAVYVNEFDLPGPPANHIDTIIMFRAYNSEITRDLYTLGTMMTDVPSWKGGDSGSVALNTRSDMDLWEYNGVDGAVTARCAKKLLPHVHRRQQQSVVEMDFQVQEIARGMKRLGMYVDEDKRKELEAGLQGQKRAHRGRIKDIVGSSDFNPNSFPQVGRLLYEDWKLPILGVSEDTGEPSTDDDTLRALIHAKVLDEQQEEMVLELRRLRKVSKELSTYVTKLRPWNDYRKNSKGKLVGGLVGPDGRVHPDYNVHTPSTGRLSSSNPNCFDAETEILTSKGWVRFDQLLEEHRKGEAHQVAQWSLDDEQISFVAPEAYHEHDYDGDMVQLQHQSADLLMTGNHRIPLRNRKTGKVKTVHAIDIPRPKRSPSDWQTVHAGHYAGGKGLDLTEDEVRFLVAVQADAHIRKDGYGLDFGFSKPRKINRIRSLLRMLGYNFSEYPGEDRTRFYVPLCYRLERLLKWLGPKKTFGPWVLDLSRGQLDVMLEEAWFWDGCYTRKSQFASSIKGNADWVQTAIALSGVRANQRVYLGSVSPSYQVDVKRRKYNAITHKAVVETSHYTGKVYCVTVPSSYIVVRRQGKITITGQSQNFPKHLRSMIIPAPGHCFVGADYDQIELRLICALAGVESYLATFRGGGDPHAVTALLIYGDIFKAELRKSLTRGEWAFYQKTGAPPKAQDENATDMYVSLRRFAKTFVYAVIYGGSAQTIYNSVSAAEDDNGNLLFPDMKLGEVKASYRSWMRNAKEIPAYWDTLTTFANKHKYLVEPIGGRRRDFYNPRHERNEILNFPIQGGAGIIMGRGLIKLVDVMPFDFAGEFTGVVNQCHDAVTCEAPDRDRDIRLARERIQESLECEHGGMHYTAEASKAVYTWKEAA